MRQAMRRNPSRARVSQGEKIKAPVKGWYTAESIADAPRGSAIVLDNWFPEEDAIRVRRGTLNHYDTKDSSNAVETLISYQGGGTSKLLAIVDGAIADATSSGSADDLLLVTDLDAEADLYDTTANVLATGLNTSRWQYVNFVTSGGQFAIMVSGQDTCRKYDGTSVTTNTVTGTGLSDPTTLINVAAHKKRLWFVEANSTKCWYLPVDTIAGAATGFEFGSLLKKGGHIMATGTWSVDAGDGMDDMFVAISSEGEMVVYSGTDPSSASDWQLVGVYDVAPPIGRRCFYKVGGDLALISTLGIVPVSKAIQLDKAVLSVGSITKNIATAYNDAVQSYSALSGWEIAVLPPANMAIVNVPISEGSVSQQFVMNTTTGAWARFTGINAQTWVEHENRLYFGAPDGVVVRAEIGGNDRGSSIDAVAVPAYDDYGSPGILKHFKMTRPVITSNVAALPSVTLLVDYEDPENITPGSGSAVLSGFVWDVSNWDEATWPGTNLNRDWSGEAGVGSAFSPAFAVSVDAGSAEAIVFRLAAYHVVTEDGNIVG